MITKSKNTLAAEKELAALNARLTKAKIDLDKEFETALAGDRLPGMTATVSLIERRITTAEKALHDCRVADAVAEVDRLTTEHAAILKTYHQKRAKFEDETIAQFEKASIGKKIARDRKLAPAWLVQLRRDRHDAHSRLLAGYAALRTLDPKAADARAGSILIDFVAPPPAKIEV